VGYADKPQSRPDDWSGVVRSTDDRLGPVDDPLAGGPAADEGGLKRHPELEAAEPPHRPEPPRHEPRLLDDDFDAPHPILDRNERARKLSAVQRAHGANRGDDGDLLPRF
jgi:type IV secretion system protein VirD4